MSAGLIGTGTGIKNRSMQGLSEATRMQQQREQTEDSLDVAEETADKQMIGTGAGIGAMAGMQYGVTAGAPAGPIGMAAGAVIGAAAGWLATEVF
jgi:uncharacterized membrane protein